MNTKKTVFSRIAKGMTKKKVELGLIDNFNYDYQYLEDQAGLLSYLAYEWHEDAFEEYRQAWMKLNDEYTHNGSSVVRYDDVEGDMALLEEIKVKAEELGLDPNDVYDTYDLHLELLQSVKESDDQYKRNEMQFRDWSS
jgi:hypothetical protein